jgi:hypothetical protein
MKPNYLPILQLCIDRGLQEGYDMAHARQAEPPCKDDLVCDQYHRIMHHLRMCLQFEGTGHDETEV